MIQTTHELSAHRRADANLVLSGSSVLLLFFFCSSSVLLLLVFLSWGLRTPLLIM
jgi:hypothetical protein